MPDIKPPMTPAKRAIMIAQKRKNTGMKQQTTISQAAKILNAILRIEGKGTSTSTIATRSATPVAVDDTDNGTAARVGVGDGSCVPYFSVGR